MSAVTQTLFREFVVRTPDVALALAAYLKQHAGRAAANGRPLRVLVVEAEQPRTIAQNKRYFGYLLKAIAAQGWVDGRQFSAAVWHDHLAEEFGVIEEVVMPNGEIRTRRKSTTEMSVAEFSEFMQRVEAYAATELGVRFDELA